MTDNKNMQLIDKMARNRIFNSKYWKQQCFALNAQTFIDKAISIRYVGGLYSGAKKPTKFLCLVFKLLQMNLPIEIAVQYLKVRQFKYLNAIALFYLRLVLKGVQCYETLQPFYNDNRKLCMRNSIGEFSIIHIDELIDSLLREQVYLGIALPFLQKRIALEQMQLIEPRVSILEQQQNEQIDVKSQMQEQQK